jgi:exonuclease III
MAVHITTDKVIPTQVKNLNICSYNMHGFNNGNSFLKVLCNDNDILFVQEHWLLSQHLAKLNNINNDFIVYGVSAMDAASSRGILRGRPFGGVGVLIHKSLSKFVSFCGVHQDNRAIAIRYTHGDLHIIFVGVYFPCD